jgi:excinuclease ABC subunit B
MYADVVTPSMRAAIDETNRRREKQDAFNRAHGIVPQTIIKNVRDLLDLSAQTEKSVRRENGVKLTDRERRDAIEKLEKQMREASRMLEFEIAAQLRDEIILLRGEKDK